MRYNGAYDVKKVVDLMRLNSEIMQKIIAKNFDREVVYPAQKLFMAYTDSLINNVKSGRALIDEI